MDKLVKARYYYRLSQEAIAVFLETSRSIVAMAEVNKRVLPTNSIDRLSFLLRCWGNNKNTESSLVLKQVEAELLKQIQGYRKQCLLDVQMRINTQRERILKEEQLYEEQANLLRSIVTLSSSHQIKSFDMREEDKFWLEHQLGRAKKDLIHQGKVVTELKVGLAILENELRYLEEGFRKE